MTPSVVLREVGLRDGLQSLATVMPTSDKIGWIEAEHAAGVREIEVASFVPARLMPQMADAAELVSAAKALPGLTIAVLAPNAKGAARAIEAGADKVVFVVSASAKHNFANVGMTIADSLAQFEAVAALIEAAPRPTLLAGGISTAFGCTLQGEVSPADVIALARALVDRGARELTIADTVGFAAPGQVERLFSELTEILPHVSLAGHFHDTRGLGLANVWAAYSVGVRAFDASLGGLGGCPHAPGATGNIVMEDTALLFARSGIATGLDLDKLLTARRQIEALLPEAGMHGALVRAGRPETLAA